MKPRVAVTMGDMNGIGPEVALKAVVHPSVLRVCTPVLVGLPEVFEFYGRRLRPRPAIFSGALRGENGPGSGRIHIASTRTGRPASVTPGRTTARAGMNAFVAIAAAAELALAGDVQAIVTAPVSKRALHKAGVNFPGQTELLQALTRSRTVAMMLVSPSLRVGLVTIHEPLARVPALLTRRLIVERTMTLYDGLRLDWGIRRPRLAMLGLNPHAGEDGDLGQEERQTIIPAIHALRRAGIRVDGPFPADTFFGRPPAAPYDAVVAMYHDQGLIPLKMTAGGKGVNHSVGLTIVRTSPDHGTAFPIAGSSVADPRSMIEAVHLAVRFARNRKQA